MPIKPEAGDETRGIRLYPMNGPCFSTCVTDGVVGLFPILSDGGWILNDESDPHKQYAMKHDRLPGAFRYQSCSGRLSGMRGTFGGQLEFYPGTKRKPTGKPFRCRLE